MTGQSHRMSVIESLANTFGGFGIALAAQVTLFAWLHIDVPWSTNLSIAIFMMGQSLVRQYAFRRFFNWLHIKETRHGRREAHHTV